MSHNSSSSSPRGNGPITKNPQLKISTAFSRPLGRNSNKRVNPVAGSQQNNGVELFPDSRSLGSSRSNGQISPASPNNESSKRKQLSRHSSSGYRRNSIGSSASGGYIAKKPSSLRGSNSFHTASADRFSNPGSRSGGRSPGRTSSFSMGKQFNNSASNASPSKASGGILQRSASFLSNFSHSSANNILQEGLDNDPAFSAVAAKYAIKDGSKPAGEDATLAEEPSEQEIRRLLGRKSPFSLFFTPFSVEKIFLKYFYGGKWNLRRRFYIFCAVLCFAALIGLSFLHSSQNVWKEFYGRVVAFAGILLSALTLSVVCHITIFELLFVSFMVWIGFATIYCDTVSLTETYFNYLFLIFLNIIVFVYRVRWIYSSMVPVLVLAFIAFDFIYNFNNELGWGFHIVLWLINIFWGISVIFDWRRLENHARNNFSTLRELQWNRRVNEGKVNESVRLLHNILPVHMIERMQQEEEEDDDSIGEDDLASVESVLQTKFYYKRSASVVFIDIVDFSKFSAKVTSRRLANNLNALFKSFDTLLDRCNLDKCKVVGDAYVALSLFQFHSKAACDFALLCLKRVNRLSRELNWDLKIRLGIASGPLTLGVFGTHLVTFDAFGKTMQLAELLEENSQVLRILVDQSVYSRTHHQYSYTKNEKVIQKEGSDEIVESYYLNGDMLGDVHTPGSPVPQSDSVTIQVRPSSSTSSPRRGSVNSFGAHRASSTTTLDEAADMDSDADSNMSGKNSSRLQAVANQDAKSSPLMRSASVDDTSASVPRIDSFSNLSRNDSAVDLRSETSSMISRYSSLASISMRSAAPALHEDEEEREAIAQSNFKFSLNYLCNTFLNPKQEWEFIQSLYGESRWLSLQHTTICLGVALANLSMYFAIPGEHPATSQQAIVLYSSVGLHLILFVISLFFCLTMALGRRFSPLFEKLPVSVLVLVTQGICMMNMLFTAVVPFFFLQSPLLLQMSVFTIVIFMYPGLLPYVVRALPPIGFVVGWHAYHMIQNFVTLQVQNVAALVCFVSLMSISSYTELFNLRRSHILTKKVSIESKKVDTLDNLIDRLILSSLPREVYDRLKVSRETICDWVPNCCILFLKLWGFSEAIMNTDDSKTCLYILERLFNLYDELSLESKDVFKVKSTGEYYLMRGESSLSMLLMALDFLEGSADILPPQYHVTIGVTTGPVCMAVLGKTRLNYDVFGSVVNLSSRLCTTSEPNNIQVTEETVNFLHERNQDLSLSFEKRDKKVHLKGIDVMQTYYVHRPATAEM